MTTPLAVPAVPGQAVAPQQPRPLRRHRGLFWAGVLAALAATAGGALITTSAYVSQSEPATAAVEYFHDLESGNAAGALGLGALPAGSRAYLTSQVLDAELSLAMISGVRVLTSVRHGDAATVDVEYQLGALQVSDAVALTRHGRRWRLTRAAVPVHLAVPGGIDRMSIAGAPVPTSPTLFFPGVLPVAVDTPDLTLGALPVVHLDGAVPHTLALHLSAPGRQQVDDAVQATLAACLSGKAAPAGSTCPVQVPNEADARVVPGTIRGRVITSTLDHLLTITVDPSAGGLLDISGSVSVNATYQQLDFDNQPVHDSGKLTLTLKAHCYATTPTKLVWGATP